MSKIKRLTSEHPHWKKFDELSRQAEDLGISMSFMGCRTLVTIDDQVYDLCDRESVEESVPEFPHPAEWQLVVDLLA